MFFPSCFHNSFIFGLPNTVSLRPNHCAWMNTVKRNSGTRIPRESYATWQRLANAFCQDPLCTASPTVATRFSQTPLPSFTDYVLFRCFILERVSFPPSFVSLFSEIGPPIFFSPWNRTRIPVAFLWSVGPPQPLSDLKIETKLHFLRSDYYKKNYFFWDRTTIIFSKNNTRETSAYKKVKNQTKNLDWKSVGTLVRLLWRAAAPGLKPLRLLRAPTWKLGFWNISGYLGKYGIQIDPSVTEQIDPSVTEPELRPEPVLSVPWNKVYYNSINMYSQSHLGLHFRKLF